MFGALAKFATKPFPRNTLVDKNSLLPPFSQFARAVSSRGALRIRVYGEEEFLEGSQIFRGGVTFSIGF